MEEDTIYCIYSVYLFEPVGFDCVCLIIKNSVIVSQEVVEC